MTARDHGSYHDDIGAYLLGALTDLERQAFERHMAACDECQEEVARLRPAAEAIPSSVERVAPPVGLKESIMTEVRRDLEAERRAAAGDTAPAPRRPLFRRPLFRPLAGLAAIMLLGLSVAVGVTQLGGDDEGGARTIAATVDQAMPEARGGLTIDEGAGTLRLRGMPDLGATRVYQVWTERGGEMVPAQTFEAGRDGAAVVELPDLSGADGVFVTREPRGGAQVPSEEPIVSVPL